MKIFILISSLVVLASCSSNPYKKETSSRDQTMKHISQKPEALDGEFDPRFKKSGKEGSYLVAVGSVKGSLEDDDNVLLDKAAFKARVKLTQSAPSEYKSIVQQQVGDSTNNQDTGYERTDISITEVRALTGFESSEEDRECKRFSYPTSSGDYKYVKECRAVVKLALANLEKAFKYTLKAKYGITEKNKADEMLSSNISK